MNLSKNCPHCGANFTPSEAEYFFECGTERIYGWDNTKDYNRTDLCRERELRQKAEAKNQKLRELFNEARWLIIDLQEEISRMLPLWDETEDFLNKTNELTK